MSRKRIGWIVFGVVAFAAVSAVVVLVDSDQRRRREEAARTPIWVDCEALSFQRPGQRVVAILSLHPPSTVVRCGGMSVFLRMRSAHPPTLDAVYMVEGTIEGVEYGRFVTLSDAIARMN